MDIIQDIQEKLVQEEGHVIMSCDLVTIILQANCKVLIKYSIGWELRYIIEHRQM
jgi:hypothetical protein